MWSWLFGKAQCIHDYEKIADLRDSEDNSKAVKTIYVCRLCLDSVEKVFSAPGYCLHNWSTVDSCKLVNSDGRKGSRYKQTCTKCGELRKVDLI